MKRFALATAALLSLAVAAPALASDQLAATLGVAGAGFTTSELAQLKAAYDEDDTARVNALLDRSGVAAGTASTKSHSGAGGAQLARGLGVDASDYTLGELAALKSAMENDDAIGIQAITSHAAAGSADNPDARIQLGLSVGLDAMTHSRADLAAAHES